VECEAYYKIHFDHVIPYSWGGSDTVENLQILCERCNLRKGNRHL
jgi:5-methylcytosine-specific restriction endonuclease McrA